MAGNEADSSFERVQFINRNGVVSISVEKLVGVLLESKRNWRKRNRKASRLRVYLE